jgi:predicted enzyme related to lactoylglutathione lyase
VDKVTWLENNAHTMSVPLNSITYIEVVTEQVSECCDFYAAAYGWNFEAPIADLGGARVAVTESGTRWGIRAPMAASESPTVRTYIRVADIEQAGQRAVELGGVEALGATELGAHGKVAIFLLHGIEQGIWEFKG